MAGFADSYLGRLREVVGTRLILMPSVRIVVEDEQGRFLLQERADVHRWGLPGGHAEDGEDIVSIMERELAEETGLIVKNPPAFGFGSDPEFETFIYPNGDQVHAFVMMFYTRDFTGEARVADDESSAVGWFGMDALPDLLPSMRRSLDAYLRFKQTGVFQMI